MSNINAYTGVLEKPRLSNRQVTAIKRVNFTNEYQT